MSLNTDPEKGLSNERAKELLDYYGPNTLTPTTHFMWPRLLFKALCTGIIVMLHTYVLGIFNVRRTYELF